jgi:hypothetical protein
VHEIDFELHEFFGVEFMDPSKCKGFENIVLIVNEN